MAQKLNQASEKVTLDANGYGLVTFSPSGVDWKITALSVTVSTNTSEPVATTYLNVIGDAGVIDSTWTGSKDTTDTVFVVSLGESLYVEWSGGDPGAVASARLTGWIGQPGEFNGA